VLVLWGDAHASTDEADSDDADEAEPVKTWTIGFLLGTNDAGITVVTDCWEKKDEGGHGRNFIPWGMVISWWTVEF